MAYTPPERHEDAVISCAVTPDHRHVTTGTKKGAIGVWDARTGAMVAIHQKPMPSLTRATAVASTPDGAFILCMQSNQIHYFRSKDLVDYDKNSGRNSKFRLYTQNSKLRLYTQNSGSTLKSQALHSKLRLYTQNSKLRLYTQISGSTLKTQALHSKLRLYT